MLLEIPEFFPLVLGLSIGAVAYRLSAFLKAKSRKVNVDAAYTENELERIKKAH